MDLVTRGKGLQFWKLLSDLSEFEAGRALVNPRQCNNQLEGVANAMDATVAARDKIERRNDASHAPTKHERAS